MVLPQAAEECGAKHFLHTQNPNDSDKSAVPGCRRMPGALDRAEPVAHPAHCPHQLCQGKAAYSSTLHTFPDTSDGHAEVL